ncbi:MAG TPA: cell division protein FtsL [Candidatus Binataceae bacterium]|nr:cell division protein FtsL [Candidatus Binataceae bacterium]
MNRRSKPTAQSSWIIPALLGVAVVAAGFATLMIRLEATQEGYRLSALRLELRTLEQQNQRLRLEAAELSSHERLRALAPRYGLRPPAAGQIVMMR